MHLDRMLQPGREVRRYSLPKIILLNQGKASNSPCLSLLQLAPPVSPQTWHSWSSFPSFPPDSSIRTSSCCKLAGRLGKKGMVRARRATPPLHPTPSLDCPTWKSVCSVSHSHLIVPGVQSPPTATPSALWRAQQRPFLRATPAPRRGALKVKCCACGCQGALATSFL